MTQNIAEDQWLNEIVTLERAGDVLRAWDRSQKGLMSFPDSAPLRYHGILNLARSGAVDLALQHFEGAGLARSEEEDAVALGARLKKDLALREQDPVRRRTRLRDAAVAYETVYHKSLGHYPAINAASLYVLAGDKARAEVMAEKAQAAAYAHPSPGYYELATQAEAAIILGCRPDAEELLVRARDELQNDWAALATTRAQLRLVSEVIDGDAEWIDRLLTLPVVAHYAGHKILSPGQAGRFPSSAEAIVAAQIDDVLASENIGFLYGSLASGGDILFAESALRKGLEVHVFLPFEVDEFCRVSVEPAQGDWEKRFYRCLDGAASVSVTSYGGYQGDDALFAFCSHVAMGSALIRARHLGAACVQALVWDGEPADGDAKAGTARDALEWQQSGRDRRIVTCPVTKETQTVVDGATSAREERAGGRRNLAILFADVKGYSQLDDAAIPEFRSAYLTAFAEALKPYQQKILHRNTWGDAVHVIFSDVLAAAECAIAVQARLSSLPMMNDKGAHGVRVGLHYGPVFEGYDPVRDEPTFFGANLSRAARIEPITPMGNVYVSDNFAAALALSGDGNIVCDYVGTVPLAKGWGEQATFSLRLGKAALY